MLLFILIGAAVGLFLAGSGGLLLGAALGWGLGQLMTRVLLPHGLAVVREQFFESTFAVMGALCKADGVVSGDEIRVAEQFFERLGLSADQREAARSAFNRGKREGFDLAGEMEKLRAVVRGNPALLQLFVQMQLSAIAADGVLHDAEHEMILRIARLLGLSEVDVRRLEATLRGAAGSAGHGASAFAGLDRAYAALGVESSASDAEVKKAYRRLMSRHHPDKLAARGMPENMRGVAEERVREIRAAYDAIRKSRDQKRAA